MTVVVLDSTNPRCAKAILLAVTADTWPRRDRDGVPFFLVPSQSEQNISYLCSTTECSCADAARDNRCKHQLAVAIYIVLQTAAQTKLRKRRPDPTTKSRRATR